MRLRNKKTGEIIEGGFVLTYYDGIAGNPQRTLAELNEEWEDYEEPKEFWYIGEDSDVHREETTVTQNFVDNLEQIGNYFETKEEAEKAVEKLEAWKRLKDKGLKINRWLHTPDMKLTTGSFIKIEGYIPAVMKNMKDLDLLFGGGE